MSRLLRADFSRMFKSLIFKLGLIFSVVLAAGLVIGRYIDFEVNAEIYAQHGYITMDADDMLFTGCFFIMFAVAVFIGIFIGTDYSDGTIRNKLMVGHKRSHVYFANYITCITATLLFNAVYIITVFVLGFILFGNTHIPAGRFFTNVWYIVLTTAALDALFLFFSMFIKSKAAASVTLLIMAIVLWLLTMTIVTSLEAPEYYNDSYYMDENGEIVQGEFKNPKYITGNKRAVYEFMCDLLPSTQYYQIMQWDIQRPVRYIVCDVVIVVVMMGAGVVMFMRKDLK